MSNEIIKNLGLTVSQIEQAVRHIKNGEGLYVVACTLGLDRMRECEQDKLIHNLGIFEFANDKVA